MSTVVSCRTCSGNCSGGETQVSVDPIAEILGATCVPESSEGPISPLERPRRSNWTRRISRFRRARGIACHGCRLSRPSRSRRHRSRT